jgi:hypothetical protein
MPASIHRLIELLLTVATVAVWWLVLSEIAAQSADDGVKPAAAVQAQAVSTPEPAPTATPAPASGDQHPFSLRLSKDSCPGGFDKLSPNGSCSRS